MKETNQQDKKLQDYRQEKSKQEEIRMKKSRKKCGMILGIVIFLVVVGIIVGFLLAKFSKLHQTEIDPDEIANNELSNEQALLMSNFTQFVFLGVDNRTNGSYGHGNSDTIMLASLNNQTKEVKLVSLYRDTYLRIDEDYFGKANGAYAYDGAVGALAMINTNLDLDVSRYVTVDWYAVVKGIDLLGGIDIEITEAERQKINEYAREVAAVTGEKNVLLTESGLVHLNGVQVMAYMRIRKLAGNDYMRTQRQRVVIEKVFQKVKGADLGKLNQMVDHIFPMVETNLSLTELLGLGMHMGQYNIQSTTGFPFVRTTTTLPRVGDCVVPMTLESNVTQLHRYLFGDVAPLSREVLGISEEILSRSGCRSDNSYIDSDNYTTGKMEEWEEK